MLGILAVFLASRLYAPSASTGPVICVTHGIFGLPCPGCGMTRAFCSLAYADVGAALRYNALSIPVVLGLLMAAGVAAWEIVSRRRARLHGLLFSYRFAWCWAVAVIAYHAFRCVVWTLNGYLVSGYLKTSWTYNLFFRG